MNTWNIDTVTDLSGKVVIVTGANTGLGFATAKVLSGKGATVIMACRSNERASTAKDKILKVYPEAILDIMLLDLSDLLKIKQFATAFKEKYKRLDILINNAGVMTTPYMKTTDGFEFQNGINHLGHFALTAHLFDLLKSTQSSRVVVVSSIAHKNALLNLNDYMFKQEENYTPMKSYRQSKLSNLIFMYELNRRIQDKNLDIKVVGAHPGVSRTDLARYLINGFKAVLVYPLLWLFTQSAKKGALPQIRAAIDKDVTSGDYYGPRGYKEMKGKPVLVKAMPNALNESDAKALWELSEQLTKVPFVL
jgi:NAD(P)-dependent dehydrogenase (short-subunit alcohol dehydrogenase family)